MKEIFLVEDDEGIRELIEYLLLSKEYKVKAFPTAGKFRRSMTIQKPDLILLDVMLPDGNGVEMCRELGKGEDTSNIPVVLMSAHVDDTVLQEDCVKDFIAKPFDVDDFLIRIDKHFN